jgi:hypothetical protein
MQFGLLLSVKPAAVMKSNRALRSAVSGLACSCGGSRTYL